MKSGTNKNLWVLWPGELAGLDTTQFGTNKEANMVICDLERQTCSWSIDNIDCRQERQRYPVSLVQLEGIFKGCLESRNG